MSFETGILRMVAPLDPYEGDKYNESVDEDACSLLLRIFVRSLSIRKTISIPQQMVS